MPNSNSLMSNSYKMVPHLISHCVATYLSQTVFSVTSDFISLHPSLSQLLSLLVFLAPGPQIKLPIDYISPNCDLVNSLGFPKQPFWATPLSSALLLHAVPCAQSSNSSNWVVPRDVSLALPCFTALGCRSRRGKVHLQFLD